MLQIIYFPTRIEIKALVELPAKRVSLRNELPAKLNPPFCKAESPHFANPIFIENSTDPFLANFQRPHTPLNKGKAFPDIKCVLRVLIL